MYNGRSGASLTGRTSLSGSATQVAAWLLRAGAGLGLLLYVSGLAVGNVDLATVGVVTGVCGAVGNLLIRTVSTSVGGSVD